ncbi:MAG TPA: YcgN family cysteine cluster protein [Xanthobacteraceae bacterium]|nr:YcgN family cysteine cluster protein [Xanthobacteraceae bacterium]
MPPHAPTDDRPDDIETTLASARTGAPDVPFWKRKTLEEMTQAEWESICDGCGRCCLNKIEEEDTGDIYFTNVPCALLDPASCGCADYPNRQEKVPDCVQLTPANVREIPWLPPTCGYRLLAEGRSLYWWHPLVSGDPDTVHQAAVSVRGRLGPSETDVPVEQLEDYIVRWPMQLPRAARGKRPR